VNLSCAKVYRPPAWPTCCQNAKAAVADYCTVFSVAAAANRGASWDSWQQLIAGRAIPAPDSDRWMSRQRR
jgi:hypothetical protein